MNTLYFGDNIHILRDFIHDESVDLIYLDPPFNSKRNYNVYLNTPKGHQSDAQITAFEDSWHWSDQAEQEYSELLRHPNTDIADLMASLRRFLHESDMMAYLVMMTSRLLELHRVLKPTGSLYLHCDPTASHYLKIVLDNVFGLKNFKNEIIWSYNKWAVAGNTFSKNHDVILFYSKEKDESVFNIQYQERAQSTLKRFGNKKIVSGFDATGNREPSKTVEEDSSGVKMSDVWSIPIIAPSSKERLGYPTQKPVALLERIIQASSNPGDVILDPFCGCGTAVHAAQKLGRQWIGIDITHLSIHLIERRLRDSFPEIQFETHGIPKDFGSAASLADRDKYEFQYWACSLVGAQPYKGGKKGADGGIDGIRYFNDDDQSDKKIIVSVKGGGVTRTMIADLKNTVDREKASMGLFVTLLEPTAPMRDEAISAGFYTNAYEESFPKIQILTIKDLLSGKTPALRDLTRGSTTFKKAKQEKIPKKQEKLL